VFLVLPGLLLVALAGTSVEAPGPCYTILRHADGEPIRWSIDTSQDIPFRIDESVPAEWHMSVRLAAATWNAALKEAGVRSIRFRLASDPQSSNVIRRGLLPEKYRRDSFALSPTEAEDGETEDSLGSFHRLTKLELIFSSAKEFTVTGERRKFDVQGIATHEFGHWLGLGDLESEEGDWRRCAGRSVMVHPRTWESLRLWLSPNAWSQGLRTVKPDDVQGLKALYRIAREVLPGEIYHPSDVIGTYTGTWTSPSADRGKGQAGVAKLRLEMRKDNILLFGYLGDWKTEAEERGYPPKVVLSPEWYKGIPMLPSFIGYIDGDTLQEITSSELRLVKALGARLISSVRWARPVLSPKYGSYYEMEEGRLWSKYTGYRGQALVEFREDKTGFVGGFGKWEVKGDTLELYFENPVDGKKSSTTGKINGNTITITLNKVRVEMVR